MNNQLKYILISLFLVSSSVILIEYYQKNHNRFEFKTTDYTFYQVEIEWPGSVCKMYNCTREYLNNYNGQHFNLHGVWPTGVPTNNCQYVNSCQDLPFDNSLITPNVMDQLNQYWTGLYNSSETFRKHEWEKHGVCWNDNNTLVNANRFLSGDNLATYMNDYFSFALSVIETYDPIAILAQGNISPSDTIPFDYSTAMNLLRPYLGDGVIGKCAFVDGQQYLHSIDFCLNLNNQPSDCLCAKAKKTNCNAALPVYLGEFVMPSQ